MSVRLTTVTLLLMACASSLFAQSALTMTKTFTPSTVTVGGSATTTLTVTITNPNAFTVSGIGFSDTYPAGLVPDQVGAYTCTPGSALFTGTGFAFNGFSLAAGASCSAPILMHATILGQITNTTSQVTGTGVPPGGPATAVLTVVSGTSAPTLSEGMLLVLVAALAVVAATAITRSR